MNFLDKLFFQKYCKNIHLSGFIKHHKYPVKLNFENIKEEIFPKIEKVLIIFLISLRLRCETLSLICPIIFAKRIVDIDEVNKFQAQKKHP